MIGEVTKISDLRKPIFDFFRVRQTEENEFDRLTGICELDLTYSTRKDHKMDLQVF